MLTRTEQSLVDSVIRDDAVMGSCATPEATIWRNRAVQLAEIAKRLEAKLHDGDVLADYRRRTRRCKDCRVYETCEDADVGYWCSEWKAANADD